MIAGKSIFEVWGHFDPKTGREERPIVCGGEKEGDREREREEGIALRVLTQRLGSEPQPVAYLSKKLDPTAQGWPPCLRNLAAIAIMVEDTLKLSFGGKLTIFTSHQVKQLLNERGHLSMSDQRLLRYQVILMENPGLTISPCEVLNPPFCLPPRALSPYTPVQKPWTTGQNPERDYQKILWSILKKSGTLMEAALSWWKKKSQICSSLKFWDHRG